MTASLEEVLQQVRGRMLRNGDHEGAAGVVELIAASVECDELTASLQRRDEEAVVFHTEVLGRLLAGIGRFEFRIVENGRDD